MTQIHETSPLPALRQAALTSPAAGHPLLAAIARGQVTPPAMACVLQGYVAYSRRFPQFVSAAMAWWNDSPRIAMLLRTVFLDEAGEAEGQEPHYRQLERCAMSLGPPPDDALLRAYRRACERYAAWVIGEACRNPLSALGALGPATELIVPTIYGQIVAWFDRNPSFDGAFFREHVGMDHDHYTLVERAIEEACVTSADWIAVERSMQRTLRQRALLWDRLEVLICRDFPRVPRVSGA